MKRRVLCFAALMSPTGRARCFVICAGKFWEVIVTSGQMGSYPISYNVAYPEEGLSRISTLFRIILAIPALLVSTILAGTTTLPLVLLILFRRKYPRWWFDFNLERARYAARVNVYLSLMTDRYPSTDEAQSVTLDFEYPDADGLNRFLPLIKWLLAIPHYVILYVLWMISLLFTIIAWLAIIFTGKYPRGLFDFVVGVHRWSLRVSAYTSLLITDRYPPFSMS